MALSYQGCRSNYGTDSERYLASLFQMRQEHQGSRFPDLMTDIEWKKYSPHLAIESKSGKDGGKLLAEQLVYAVSTAKQYARIIGEDPTKLEGWLEGYNPFLSVPYHLFYNNIKRIDDLKAPDLDKDFSAIKMRWGDQYIIPANVIHAYFAARMCTKDGFDLGGAKAYLKEVTMDRIARESSMSHLRDRNAEFQNFELIYSKAFYNRTEGNTDNQKRVIGLVHEQIGDLNSYPRKTFIGPCNTRVHIIGNPKTPGLIRQMGESIIERRARLTEVAEERLEAISLLNSIASTPDDDLFLNGDITEARKSVLRRNLTLEQIGLLERLVSWKSKGDAKELEKPDDDIPF